ncbi:MAG: hypothetical protein SGILL_002005 [Bacillariaceae sp.]
MAVESKDLKRKRKPKTSLSPPGSKKKKENEKPSTKTNSKVSTSSSERVAKRRTGRNSVVSRLARAAKEAAAAREQREALEKAQEEESTMDGKQQKQTKYPSRHKVATRKPYAGYDEETLFAKDDDASMDPNLSTISTLNHVIDEELLHPKDGFKPARETDSLRLLLEHNNKARTGSEEEDTTKSTKKTSKKTKSRPHQAAIVFARPLIDDQITIEFASRLVSLAKAIKFENFKPEWICFCPSLGGGSWQGDDESNEKLGSVSETAAGIIFFRHLCLSNDISLEGTGLCQIPHMKTRPQVWEHTSQSDVDALEGDSSAPHFSSWPKSSFHPIVESLVHQGYLDKWLDESDVFESETDEYGMTREEPRKKVDIDWTLFSTDYDLCNLNDIHVRSPRQSPLAMLSQDLEHAVRKKEKFRRGIVETTWSFQYSIYPFVVYSDTAQSEDTDATTVGTVGDLTAFLGKCYLMAQDLVPLMVNMRGVSENSEFFRRDNYRRLVKTRRLLATLLEQMNEAYLHNREYKSATMSIPPTLKAQLKEVTSRDVTSTDSRAASLNGPTSSTEIQMESALLSLGRCCDLVRPAGTFSAQSVTRQEWKGALHHLQDFMNCLEMYCDPDQPLPAEQWGLQLREDEPMSRIMMLQSLRKRQFLL